MIEISCPKCYSAHTVEISETIDGVHYCACIDCDDSSFTVKTTQRAFNRDGRDYYYFPSLKVHYAYRKSSLPVHLSIDKLLFLKDGKTIAKKSVPETDHKICHFVAEQIEGAKLCLNS
jgi:hypothetical protein